MRSTATRFAFVLALSSDSQSFEGHNDSVLSVVFNPVIPFQLATGGQDDKAFLLTISEEEKPSGGEHSPGRSPRQRLLRKFQFQRRVSRHMRHERCDQGVVVTQR